MKKLSSELSNLTGFPKLPHWMLRIFVRYPNLVPYRLKWKITSKGLGLLVTQIINDGGSSNKDIVSTLKELGKKQGEKVRKEFGVESKNLKESLQVIVLANRLFGINSKIADIKNLEAKTRITECSWASSSSWGPKPCAALSAWELGLVEGLNNNIKVKFLKRMSNGDDCCEASYRLIK